MLLAIVIGVLLVALLIVGQQLAKKKNQNTPATQAMAGFMPPAQPQADNIPLAQHYRSDKVGNDASALPWKQTPDFANTAHPSQSSSHTIWPSSQPGSLSLRPDQLPDRVPAHMDLALLLERSKEAFMRLHTAWENADSSSLQNLLSPAIWQQVQPAIAASALPDWGQRIGEVQHLAARALEAQTAENGDIRVKLEFTGSQLHAADGQLRPILEVWEVRYQENPALWQIADLQGRKA